MQAPRTHAAPDCRFLAPIVRLAIAIGLLAPAASTNPVAVRVATYNIEDVRTADLRVDDAGLPANPRVQAVAAVLQTIRPTIVLINELEYDTPGAPGVGEDAEPGQNAARLAAILRRPARDDLRPLGYKAVMLPTNTGRASGLDLDRSGEVVLTYPVPPGAGEDGSPGPQSDEGRAFGGDAWGFGTYPGQYAMALLVDERLEVLEDQIRTFRLFPWAAMPGNLMPTDPESGEPWFVDGQDKVRLSSKSHWDVPVRLPNGGVVHLLCSHPTPPAFDGPEQRNKRRNHDEIRFWADYLLDAQYIIDDAGKRGGLKAGSHFVILGDLNADPDEGSSMDDPIGLLLASPRVRDPEPRSEIEVPRLDADDTAMFRLRVDYALPSESLRVLRTGMWRPQDGERSPSDHFPVWVEVAVPSPG